jgi:hypothetical protein
MVLRAELDCVLQSYRSLSTAPNEREALVLNSAKRYDVFIETISYMDRSESGSDYHP